jgi:2-methylcitrate dehydratase PrpD
LPTNEILQGLARFSLETTYKDLPTNVVKETKHLIMDTIGCALAALSTDKGKMHISLARQFGGPPVASIIGLGDKVSLFTAALVNGESMFTIDMHAIVAGGHDSAYVLPAPLAVAESIGASGRDMILASAIGWEISWRLAKAVLREAIMFGGAKQQNAMARQGRQGNAYSNFGAAAGAGRLLKLEQEKMVNAMGIAGHLCKVLTHGRWAPSGMSHYTKYGLPGWQNTGAIIAVLYAQMGYTGDPTLLDDPAQGFWHYVGYDDWQPEGILDKLGEKWGFITGIHYKSYPCCGMFHTAMDCLSEIIEKNNLAPEQIESIKVFSRGGASLTNSQHVVKDIPSISAAQFNQPYNISCVAHRIKRGVEWLEWDMLKNPKILDFMDKITIQGLPDHMKYYQQDPLSLPARVDVTAMGKTFSAEHQYWRGTTGTPAELPEEELIEKFRHNASRILTKAKIQAAVDAFLDLENIDNISNIMREVTL